MANINYLGLGSHGVEKPNDYYRKIDERNQVKPQAVKATDKAQKFNKVLEQAKIKASKLDSKPVLAKSFRNHVAADKKAEASKTFNQVKTAQESRDKKDGMDFALKELSIEMEQQILGILWNLAFSTVDRKFEGGIGEEIFHKELVNEMIKLSETGEMGDIAQSIYNDLKEKNKPTR